MNDIEKAIEILTEHRISCSIKIGNSEDLKKHKIETANSLDLAISALEKQLNGGWIATNERLPEEFGCYLVAWKPTSLTAEDILENTGIIPHYYGILAFDPIFEGDWIDEIEQCDDYEVIAWQPLPEPYKEVEIETNTI